MFISVNAQVTDLCARASFFLPERIATFPTFKVVCAAGGAPHCPFSARFPTLKVSLTREMSLERESIINNRLQVRKNAGQGVGSEGLDFSGATHSRSNDIRDSRGLAEWGKAGAGTGKPQRQQ
ncbi:hypothetical protein CJBVI_1667 [Corynebacterium jeikeium]|nr:hypothetical protein CJBVI_1667 [Corynebacterium jeikeium]